MQRQSQKHLNKNGLVVLGPYMKVTEIISFFTYVDTGESVALGAN